MKLSTIQFYLALLFLLMCSMAKAEDVKVTLKADMLVSDEALSSAINLADKTDVKLIFSLDEGFTNLNDEQILRVSQFAKNNWQKVTGVDFSSITSLTTLPNSTFNGADRLTSIKLPALTKLSANLFTNCSSLTSLTIGEWSNTEGNDGLEMEEIPAGCFQGCSNLINLYFKGIKNIQGWAFSGCTSMTELPIKTIATKAKVSLGSNAFENTKFTGNLVLPEGIAYVEGNCFGSCLQLNKITFPSTIEKIDATFDNNCTALTHINVQVNNYYEAINGILYKKKDGKLILTRCPIANPEPIIIPSNVTEITEQAFLGCNMTSITLNEGLLKIGGNAFGNCKNLESLTIPKSTSDIASSFVNGCEKLATLTITAGNEKYETKDNITYAKISITEDKETKAIFRVPEAYTCIDGKLDLSTVEGVTQVGNNAFEDCKNIKVLKLSDDITTIGDECFKNSGIETFYVPKHLTVEGYGLVPFSECNSLQAFAGEDLDNFTVDERGILYNKENTKLFKVPNNYKTINADGSFDIRHHIKEVQACAFEGAQQIKKVVFAQGIKELPHRCFLNAKVEKVVIPNSITTICQDVFMGSEVKEVIMLTTTQDAPHTQNNSNFNSFFGINADLKIHLSEAYGNFKDAWVTASKDFKSAPDVPRSEDGETDEEKDSRNYGWYGLNQANRLVEDVKHRAIFENSENIAGFNAEGEHNILNEKDKTNNLSAQHYDYITLYRDFSSMKGDEYATLALPVDITKATLKAAFGSNTKIWKFVGRKDKVIYFQSVDFNDSSVADNEIIIKKGVAVLIQPEYKENSYLLQMNLGGEKSTDVNAIDLSEDTQTSYGTENKEIVTTTGNINIVNGVRQENVTFDYGFYATYQKKSFMEKGSYYMKTDGSFVYAVNSLWTKAFRGFIHGNDDAIGGEVSAPAKLSFDGFTTSIDDVNIDGNAYKSYDIYNINGQLVRKNATSTDGLSKGLYIMNGKKVIVK